MLHSPPITPPWSGFPYNTEGWPIVGDMMGRFLVSLGGKWQNYRVKVGDAIEIRNVEYRVTSVMKGFERGVWHKTVFLEHYAEDCRACLAHEHCHCPPCPEAVVAEWPNVIGEL